MSVRAAAFTLAAKLAAYAAGAIVSIWVARALGPHDRGVWSLCLLVTVILGLLADGGLGTAAVYMLRGHPSRSSAIVSSALRLLLLNGCLWMGIGLALALTNRLPLGDVSREALTIAVVASLFAATASVVRQLLNGLGNLRGVNLNVLTQALSLPVALSPALLLAAPTARGALWAYVCALAFTAGVAIWQLAPAARGSSERAPLLGPLVAYGVRAQLATLMLILTYRSDLLLVNHFLGVAAAGIYSVALTLSEILRGLAETGQMLVVAQARKADLPVRAQAIARQTAAATAFASLAMAAAGEVLVPVAFGDAYREAATAFWFLAPGVVGLALSYALSPLLFLEGRILVSAAAALTGLATLWLVGTLGPGEPSLIKVATASSLAYWALAGVQIGVLRSRGEIQLSSLVPTWHDLTSFVGSVRSLFTQK